MSAPSWTGEALLRSLVLERSRDRELSFAPALRQHSLDAAALWSSSGTPGTWVTAVSLAQLCWELHLQGDAIELAWTALGSHTPNEGATPSALAHVWQELDAQSSLSPRGRMWRLTGTLFAWELGQGRSLGNALVRLAVDADRADLQAPLERAWRACERLVNGLHRLGFTLGAAAQRDSWLRLALARRTSQNGLALLLLHLTHDWQNVHHIELLGDAPPAEHLLFRGVVEHLDEALYLRAPPDLHLCWATLLRAFLLRAPLHDDGDPAPWVRGAPALNLIGWLVGLGPRSSEAQSFDSWMKHVVNDLYAGLHTLERGALAASWTLTDDGGSVYSLRESQTVRSGAVLSGSVERCRAALVLLMHPTRQSSRWDNFARWALPSLTLWDMVRGQLLPWVKRHSQTSPGLLYPLPSDTWEQQFRDLALDDPRQYHLGAPSPSRPWSVHRLFLHLMDTTLALTEEGEFEDDARARASRWLGHRDLYLLKPHGLRMWVDELVSLLLALHKDLHEAHARKLKRARVVEGPLRVERKVSYPFPP